MKKVKIKVGNYLIETDNKQFIVKSETVKKALEGQKELNEEMEVKDNFKPIAYCTSLESALKHIADQVLLDNDSVMDIIAQLKLIYIQIKELRKAFEKVTEWHH